TQGLHRGELMVRSAVDERAAGNSSTLAGFADIGMTKAADAAMRRAWEIGIRMLLRLELNKQGNLEGMLHSNERGLTTNKSAGGAD
ncbi:MAG: hypothetical protein ACREX9_11255, partial [Gammaproteobacteria bacterium]